MAQGSIPAPSRVLGRYAMYEPFAAGGMAQIHYGRLLGPSGFSRTVAIKRLHAHLAEDLAFSAMFLDEARLAARIHHPNVVQTLDIESSDGELFVVLDYVHGDSLARLLHEAGRANTPFTPAMACAILHGALEGLHAAHEARDANGEALDLVHRDVSPHNLLVGVDGIARVLDFGVAKARGRAQTTRDGQLKGKLSYMAPEQLRGKVTRRSDVFAASVVLWEALTGRRLFEGDDDGDVIDRVLHRSIPSPREHAPHVTFPLEAIVMRGLERDPSRRFATAREMAIALQTEVTLATALEAGAFVERIGGEKLAERARRVAWIERESVVALGPSAGEGETSGYVPSARPAEPVPGGSIATAVVPGLARGDHPRNADVAPESLATGVATVTERHAPRPRRLASVAGLASLVGGAAGLGLVLVIGAGVRHASERSVSAQAGTLPVASQVSASAVVTAPPPSPSPPAAVSVGAVPTPHRDATDAPTRKSTTPKSHSRGACSPPYTVDDRGLRHYKSECL